MQPYLQFYSTAENLRAVATARVDAVYTDEMGGEAHAVRAVLLVHDG